MDWTAIASVSSSAAVAVVTLVANALSRRGDRVHAVALEFEKRVWESKSSALLSLIAKCEKLRSAMDSTEPVEHQQAAAFSTFALSSEMTFPSAELLAYAAQAVNDPVEKLQRILSTAMETDALFLLMGLNDIREQKEAAVANKEYEKAAIARKLETEALSAVGRESALNIGMLKLLCDQIIAEARRDLRGAHAEPLGRTPKKRLFLGWR